MPTSLTKQEQDEYVVKFIPFVRTVARRWERDPDERQDLEQEGMIGLMTAARKFDPSRGVKFYTYAYRWVIAYMMRRKYTEGTGVPIHIPAHMAELLRELRQDRGPLSLPDVPKSRIAAAKEINGYRKAFPPRLRDDSQPDPYDWDNSAHAMIDRLESPEPSPEEVCIEAERRRRVRLVIYGLKPRMREVLVRRARGDQLEDIATALGITRQGAYWLETEAIAEVRRRMGLGER